MRPCLDSFYHLQLSVQFPMWKCVSHAEVLTHEAETTMTVFSSSVQLMIPALVCSRYAPSWRWPRSPQPRHAIYRTGRCAKGALARRSGFHQRSISKFTQKSFMFRYVMFAGVRTAALSQVVTVCLKMIDTQRALDWARNARKGAWRKPRSHGQYKTTY